MSRSIAYWLIPAEPYHQWFADEIARLARELDAPRFEPHLTIHSAPFQRSQPPAEKLLASVAQRHAPCTLQPADLNHSSQFTKTLFVEFATTPKLLSISATVGAFARGDRPELHPHVSLLYKQLSNQRRASLAAAITVPFETVIFDEIAAVLCPKPTANAADVDAWQMIERLPLGA